MKLMIFLMSFLKVDRDIILVVHLLLDVQVHLSSNLRFWVDLVVEFSGSFCSPKVVLPKVW